MRTSWPRGTNLPQEPVWARSSGSRRRRPTWPERLTMQPADRRRRPASRVVIGVVLPFVLAQMGLGKLRDGLALVFHGLLSVTARIVAALGGWIEAIAHLVSMVGSRLAVRAVVFPIAFALLSVEGVLLVVDAVRPVVSRFRSFIRSIARAIAVAAGRAFAAVAGLIRRAAVPIRAFSRVIAAM